MRVDPICGLWTCSWHRGDQIWVISERRWSRTSDRDHGVGHSTSRILTAFCFNTAVTTRKIYLPLRSLRLPAKEYFLVSYGGQRGLLRLVTFCVGLPLQGYRLGSIGGTGFLRSFARLNQTVGFERSENVPGICRLHMAVFLSDFVPCDAAALPIVEEAWRHLLWAQRSRL